jgi:predicted ATPase/DNA-binding winged helix-turn-helix (wHTH) protein
MERLELLGCSVDLVSRTARWPDGDRSLSPTEVKLLGYLAEHQDAVDRFALLEEVWGYRSGVVSATVKTTVARLRSKVERDPRHPEHLITVPGAGYRFVPAAAEDVAAARDIVATAGDEPAPTEDLGEPIRSNLPPLASLLARDELVQQVRQNLLDGGRLVTLVGPGGIGKTSLSVAVASSVLGEGRWKEVAFVDLSAATDTGSVLHAVAAGLGLRIDEEPDAQSMGRALRSRGQLLLVLDNAEQAVDPTAAVLEAWLDASQITALVTSREALRLARETVVGVPRLPDEAAAALFARRGPLARPGYSDPERLLPVLKALDGLPLAIEMAAAWSEVLPPEDLARRLAQSLDLLQSARRDRPARHGSLRATVASSWELLAPEDRDAMRRLSVFESAFDVDDVEALLGPTGLLTLRGLASRSLLVAEEGGRFRPWSAVVRFAREQGQMLDAELAHGQRTARWADPDLLEAMDGQGGETLLALMEQRADLRAAARRALVRDDTDVAVGCTLALALAAGAMGPALGPLDLLGELLERELPPEDSAALHLSRGRLLQVAGRSADANADFEAALNGGVKTRAAALRLLAVQERRSDPAQGLTRAREAYDVARSSKDAALIGQALCTLSFNQKLTGAMAEAQDGFEEALILLRGARHHRFEAVALSQLARIHQDRGRPLRALSLLQAALSRQRSVGNQRAEVNLLGTLAGLHLDQGDWNTARTHLIEALAKIRRLGHRQAEGRVLANRGALELDAGDLDTAQRFLDDALPVLQETEDRRFEAIVLGNLGRAALERGHHPRARTLLLTAVAQAHQLRLPLVEGVFRGLVGSLYGAEGDLEAARVELQRGEELLAGAKQRREHVRLLERWAQVEADAGHEFKAADLLRQASLVGEPTVADGPLDPRALRA